MAPKRPSPLDEPPAASSSEEEETETSSEGDEASGSGSEDGEPVSEQPKPSPKKPESTPVLSSKKQRQSSTSGSESESDDSEPENVKPIASKPMEVTTPNTKKPRSKPAATSLARTASKRPSESDVKDSKRAKKKVSEEADDGVKEDEPKKSGDDSKKLFQRLWSEDDEIVILNGMSDYTAKKGIDPTVDMNGFHEFIKKSLHVDVSKNQLSDKVRRLRKKYENNASKGNKYRPTKSHDQKAFELSKKVWGDGGEGPSNGDLDYNGTPRTKQKGSARSLAFAKVELLSLPKSPSKEVDKMDVDKSGGVSGDLNDMIGFDKSFEMGAKPNHMMKQGLDLISESKRLELEEKWKKLHVTELELFVKRTQLMGEQAKLILEAYRSSSH